VGCCEEYEITFDNVIGMVILFHLFLLCVVCKFYILYMITLFDLEVICVVYKWVLKLLLEYLLVKCAFCVYDRTGVISYGS
jgi:hypothetical protein